MFVAPTSRHDTHLTPQARGTRHAGRQPPAAWVGPLRQEPAALVRRSAGSRCLRLSFDWKSIRVAFGKHGELPRGKGNLIITNGHVFLVLPFLLCFSCWLYRESITSGLFFLFRGLQEKEGSDTPLDVNFNLHLYLVGSLDYLFG